MVKVNAHGIQGDAARCIRNWLAGRRQRVCINQSYSNRAPVTSGVPQGDVLGPLLFLIIIYHDFLPTPGGVVMSSQVKHTHSHQDTPLSPYTAWYSRDWLRLVS